LGKNLVICLLAHLHVLQGQLLRAAKTYAQVVQAFPQPEVLHTLSSSHFYYFGLGDLLRERNDLETAERYLAQGMTLVNEALPVEPFMAILGYTAMARLQQARGNSRDALTVLDSLVQLAEHRHFAPYLMTQEAALRAQLELVQGNFAVAIRWADASGLSVYDDILPYPREGEYLVLARVRIRQGRDDPAGSLLQDVLHLL
jgi:ATP/maltotriose-dependent transcriptional regulator MalT